MSRRNVDEEQREKRIQWDEDVSVEDLTGESEYSVEEAGALVVHTKEGGPSTFDPLAVAPEDLGRRMLQDATQDLGYPDTDTGELADEGVSISIGEANMRDMAAGSNESGDRLITGMPERSEFERDNSQRARQRLSERKRLSRRGASGK